MEKITEENHLPTGQGRQQGIEHCNILRGGALGNRLAKASIGGSLAEMHIGDQQRL
ncbi:hypothetical protein D3C85_1570380 [compost metagenome]